ncbi:MAG TPA: alkaline phosphatase family protein [Candidatus Angelobacter sp.]|nr:alkaline phosphatase family protein [Candidatus Angelobacter sp.]
MKKVLCPLVCLVVLLLLSGCGGVSAGGPTPTPTPTPSPTPAPTPATLQNSVNHIIILAQENRSFDHYFGRLMQYWKANPTQFPQATNGTTLDGMPDTASNVGDPPAGGGPAPTITAFPLQTMCVENPSPSWNESHVDFNKNDSLSTVFMGDGFARTAGFEGPINDVIGARVMGYYTGDNLNYYYFMASSFGTSDRWFSPALSRTQINRQYLLAGTSQGHAYPVDATNPQLTAKTIGELMDENKITWKDYVHPLNVPNPCTTPSCLLGQSYFAQFTFGQKIVQNEPQRLATVDQFLTDANNGTLPQVSFIEPASAEGLDEHPADIGSGAVNIQTGAKFVASLINGLMKSPSWKDSVFILTWDEAGGFFDHVSPLATVSPDGIAPKDLRTNDICLNTDGSINSSATCNFQYTGYRLPLVVISPFSKKNFVSHTPADYTAILKLVETRFNLHSLTARDAAQMDMTEFFDFTAVPWKTPPTPPDQLTNGACYLDHLP